MRESRMIIISLFLLSTILGPSLYIINLLYPNQVDYFSIGCNLYCGIMVGLITSICQFCTARRRIINTVYSAYLDIYRTYYISKKKTFLFHYNQYTIMKKMEEMNFNISSALDEYHGLFIQHDRIYKKINPKIQILENYKARNIKKSVYYLFNKKYFNMVFDPFMNEIEKILMDINKRRYKSDKENMIKLYNYIMDF